MVAGLSGQLGLRAAYLVEEESPRALEFALIPHLNMEVVSVQETVLSNSLAMIRHVQVSYFSFVVFI